MTPKFSKALLAAGLAAALVGCGGGSSTTTMANPTPDPTPPGPTPEEMEAAIKAGKTAFDTAIAAADAVINDSSSSNEQMLQAYKDKKMAAETFSTVLDENGGHRLYELDVAAAYTAANSGIKTTEMKIAQAEKDRMDREKMEETIRMNDIAYAYAGIPFTNAFAGKTADYTSRLRENLMRVTIENDDPIVLTLNDDTTLNAIKGWMGQGFTGEDITAHVYHKQGVSYNQLIKGIISTNGATATTSSLNHANLIPFVNITARPVATTNNIISYSAAVNTDPIVVRGTFMGVVGDYTCADADNQQCAVRFNAETGTELGYIDGSNNFQLGAAPGSEGHWQFKPLRAGDRATSYASYASYGFWIKEDGDDWTIGSFNDYRGVEERGIATNNEVTFADRDSLQGTATYEGGAVGRYAIQKIEQDKFRAKVTLTANFNDNNVIGTITDFMTDNNGEKDWDVMLQSAAIDRTTAAGAAGAASIGTGETIWVVDNDAQTHRGEWMGQFSDFLDEENQTIGQETRKPRTVTGIFSAYAPNSKMVGGFGIDVKE